MTTRILKSEEQLKPCPFCSGEARVLYIDDLRFHYVVVGCSKCWCGVKETLGHYEKYDIEKTIKKWNTRADKENKKVEVTEENFKALCEALMAVREAECCSYNHDEAFDMAKHYMEQIKESE